MSKKKHTGACLSAKGLASKPFLRALENAISRERKPAKKRKFTVEFQATLELEIDESVIERGLSAEWQSVYYKFETPEEVAKHIAYNMVVNRAGLSEFDGFADLDDGQAKANYPEWEVDATELKPAPKRRGKAVRS